MFLLLGEGNTDVTQDRSNAQGALRVLLRRLLSDSFSREVSEWEIDGGRLARLHRGGGFAEKVRSSIALHSRDDKIEGIAVVIDRDGEKNAKRLGLLEDGRQTASDKGHRLAERTALGVMIEMLEAWLLADTSALASVLGASGAQSDPETIPDPKASLNQLIGQTGLTVTDAYDRIATMANLDALQKRCPAFERFAGEVKERMT